MGEKCVHCGKDIEVIDKIQHENYSEENLGVVIPEKTLVLTFLKAFQCQTGLQL